MRRKSAPAILQRTAKSDLTIEAGKVTRPMMTKTRPQTTPLSWRASLEENVRIQIPKRQWRFLKQLFDTHADDQEERGGVHHGEWIRFCRHGVKADEKKAVDCGRAVKARFQNKDIGYLMGHKAERKYKANTHSRKRWAQSMFQSVVTKKQKDMKATWRGRGDAKEADRISLLDFMCLSITHLPRSAVRRACEHYNRHPRNPLRRRGSARWKARWRL